MCTNRHRTPYNKSTLAADLTLFEAIKNWDSTAILEDRKKMTREFFADRGIEVEEQDIEKWMAMLL